jgi:hypothetical protein
MQLRDQEERRLASQIKHAQEIYLSIMNDIKIHYPNQFVDFHEPDPLWLDLQPAGIQLLFQELFRWEDTKRAFIREYMELGANIYDIL